jgi:hypothetical protein
VDPARGVMIQERGGHLRAAGVVDADEQDLGDVLHESSFGSGEGAQALAGEAVHEQGMRSTTRAPRMRSIDSLT